MFGAIVLASLLALVWFMLFHKNRRRRKRIHRDKRRSINPTLAETGGLPPIREEKNPTDQRRNRDAT